MLTLVQKPIWDFQLKQGLIRNVKWNYQEGMSISGLCSLPRFSRKSQLGFCTRFSTSAAIGSIVHHLFNQRATHPVPLSVHVEQPLDLPQFGFQLHQLWSHSVRSFRPLEGLVEEVMDYRTYCCAIAALVQKPTAALVLNLEVKKECKMDLPGRNVDFGALFPPLLQREIPTRFLH